MTLRLVSPDRKLFLVGTEDDLKAVGDLYNLTPKQRGNIRQLLGWTGVGNCRGDRNDRTVRYESESFMLLENIQGTQAWSVSQKWGPAGLPRVPGCQPGCQCGGRMTRARCSRPACLRTPGPMD